MQYFYIFRARTPNMLLRFGLANHYSIKEYQDFSLVSTKLKDRTEGLISVVKQQHDEKESENKIEREMFVVPVAAFYGANASGKSSLLSGLDFLAAAIRGSHSSTSSSEGTPYFPFALDGNSKQQASQYDVDIALDNTRYHYGFTLNGIRVLSEWLYSYPLDAQRQTRSVLFHRDASEKDEFQFGKSLKGENKAISKLVRPNSLFLSAAAQNAHPQLTPIYQYFATRITKRNTKSRPDLAAQLTRYLEGDPERRTSALRLLKAADVGICGVSFDKIPIDNETLKFRSELSKLIGNFLENASLPEQKDAEQADVKFLHTGEDGSEYPIDLDAESTGTKSLLTLIGPILEKLATGGVLLIDELDSTLHPLLARQLIGLFSEPSTNPGEAQLIFSTHDTNLLTGNLFRRDQIYFTEKDRTGATHVYSMSEIKVRGTENLEMGYLAGRYGAVPFLNLDAALMKHVPNEGGE